MEQLKKIGPGNMGIDKIGYYDTRRIISAKLDRKVKIELTQQQLEVFDTIVKMYLSNLTLNTIRDKAEAFRLYKLYRKHIEPKTFKTSKLFKFSLNLSETYTMYEFLQSIDFTDYDHYENTLLSKIYGTIDQQTV